VVIVGGGFGGLATARVLQNTPARIFLIDRMNHHLFKPLLYQVAIAELTPGQIASPIREILKRQENTTVILGEVTGVDKEKKRLSVSLADRAAVQISYDFLVQATEATHSYLGHDEFTASSGRNPARRSSEQCDGDDMPATH
jgi:NADH:ubiquinone reductase (H+-translocating)